MNLDVSKCPLQQTLDDFGLGKLGSQDSDAVGRHLETCLACRKVVANLTNDSFMTRLRQATCAQPAK